MTRDPWKLVTDEVQLRAGLCIEIRPCGRCMVTHRYILSRRGKPWHSYRTWHTVEPTCDGGTWTVLEHLIPRRELYALVDDDIAADETTVTRRREMVK